MTALTCAGSGISIKRSALRALAAIGRSGAQLGGVVMMRTNSVERAKVLRDFDDVIVVGMGDHAIAGKLRTEALLR